MARISGIDLPRNKRIEIALTYIYGIGHTSSAKILAESGVDPGTKAGELTDEEINNIRLVIDHAYKVEGDLRRSLPENADRFAPLLGALWDELEGTPHALDFLNPRHRPKPPSRRNTYAAS
ncbi:MAG: 30S ribosomal protein S13, partial [Proteobacteria bacterium]|nr:30S ribosomal protein S13 [Pseudomonadota bacterium]